MRVATCGTLALLLAVACGGNGGSGMDMAKGASDMALPPDMTFRPDMAVPPTLYIPTSCTTATVTAATLYTNIIGPKCATATCHQSSTPPIMGTTATTFRTSMVNVSAGRAAHPNMMYAKANDPDNSFLLYKVVADMVNTTDAQQAKVQFGGSLMPSGKGLLTATEQCSMINWVRSGAN